MDTPASFDAFTKKIPEFYFDLISRFPPGILVIVGLTLEFTPQGYLSKQDFLSVSASIVLLLLLFILVFAYVFGLVLASTAKEIFKRTALPIFERYRTKNDKEILWCAYHLNILELLRTDEQGKRVQRPVIDYKVEDFWLFYRRLHDYLKNVDAQARLILPKLSAEHSLLINLSASLTLLMAVHLLHNLDFYLRFGFTYFVPSYLFYLSWVGTIAWLWFGARFRFRRLLDSQLSYLEIVTNPRAPK